MRKSGKGWHEFNRNDGNIKCPVPGCNLNISGTESKTECDHFSKDLEEHGIENETCEDCIQFECYCECDYESDKKGLIRVVPYTGHVTGNYFLKRMDTGEYSKLLIEDRWGEMVAIGKATADSVIEEKYKHKYWIDWDALDEPIELENSGKIRLVFVDIDGKSYLKRTDTGELSYCFHSDKWSEKGSSASIEIFKKWLEQSKPLSDKYWIDESFEPPLQEDTVTAIPATPDEKEELIPYWVGEGKITLFRERDGKFSEAILDNRFSYMYIAVSISWYMQTLRNHPKYFVDWNKPIQPLPEEFREREDKTRVVLIERKGKVSVYVGPSGDYVVTKSSWRDYNVQRTHWIDTRASEEEKKRLAVLFWGEEKKKEEEETLPEGWSVVEKNGGFYYKYKQLWVSYLYTGSLGLTTIEVNAFKFSSKMPDFIKYLEDLQVGKFLQD